ncbi:potassium channel family protein [Heliophilum fasciatum]|uniref:Trk system potassium uptake protein TrkA n=1 Tax=Heliophilum fasciatum TaxID=35700 RepID=A0A4R2RIY0_9FIRM|nr:TrkA family potassium uptake protein [Heliophilum fasciatum]MCW2278610.1 trk system potassium uptake protein TrkA [Heliophilum fasciatum]TCP62688.1 trk system potassium uptake protein TrkA [Heliophilum fasciatum]
MKQKEFVVIGLGRFGSSVALNLAAMGHEVLGIDKDPELVQAVADKITHAVIADCRDEKQMNALGVRNFETAVVGIGDDIQANILISLMLKDMGIPFVAAKAQTALHGRVLEKIGVDQIVYPEKDMGARLAQSLSSNVLDFIELVPGYSIVEIVAPSKFRRKSLKTLDLRARYKATVLTIKRGAEIIPAPGGDEIIQEGDVLVILAENDDLSKLQE